ncbi:MAG: ATP-binding cassette domain-containing protein [Actinomycetota bacterium]|nr:ATP-binding cassette domain-containing protein [Actinomycetota bacterium]
MSMASGPPPSPVEAHALTRRFGSKTAVDGIDLRVEPGEIFGFLGPNGAGKTTCVRMLVTLLRPSSGWARVAGYDVERDANRVRGAIGVALQQAAVDPIMTGRELLRLQGTLFGLNKSRVIERGAELFERMGLTSVADAQVSTYSGGMRRRLDLALALLHEPGVLFLDEPTAGLDPISRLSLWEEVRRLNVEFGTSVFLTTQYLEEADQLAGRLAIIDEGRIVLEGTPASLKARVGAPTLVIDVPEARRQIAESILSAYGERVARPDGQLAVRLPGGTADVANVVRALDAAGVALEAMSLTAPTLDDVFAAATGRRLGDSDDAAPRQPATMSSVPPQASDPANDPPDV